MYPIEDGARGLYHGATGEHLLIDGLDHALLEIAESFPSRDEIAAGGGM